MSFSATSPERFSVGHTIPLLPRVKCTLVPRALGNSLLVCCSRLASRRGRRKITLKGDKKERSKNVKDYS